MSRKFNITAAITNGTITLCRTTDDKQLLLAVVTKDKSYLIPMIEGKTRVAYLPSETPEEFADLADIIRGINDSGVFKELTGAYTPWNGVAPDFSHTIVELIPGSIPGTVGMIPSNLKDLLTSSGYEIGSDDTTTVVTQVRDYSKQQEDPWAKKIYTADAAMLKTVGATYSSLPAEVKVAYEAIESGRSGGLILEGPTGTGKSFTAKILANKAGSALLNIAITDGTTVDDLVGTIVANEDAKSDTDPRWKFVKGPLLKAYSEGYQLVVEEVNFGQPGILARLNEFTDDTPRVVVNGTVYEKHPNFVVYMTMNPGYKGTECLNVALKNRFAKVCIPALSKAAFTSKMMSYSKRLGHQLSAEFFNALFDFAGFVEKEASQSKWHEDVKFSIRNAQRLCDIILQKKRGNAEFKAAVAIQYMNDLSTDNDNSEKLQSFKNSTPVREQLQKLYSLYDFGEVKTTDPAPSLDALFSEAEDAPSDSPEAKTKAMEDIMSRFGA